MRISALSRGLAGFLQSTERALPALARRHQHSWMWSVIFGVSALAVAAYIDVGTVRFVGAFQAHGLHVDLRHVQDKQVGYFAALNWSLYSIGISPVLAWTALSTWRDMPAALKRMCDNRMVRDGQFAAVDFAKVERSWRRHLRSARLWTMLVAVLGVVFVMGDWWQTVAMPLLHPHVLATHALDSPDSEYDWSISALYAGSHTPTLVLLGFTFLVYAGIPLVSTLVTLETVVAVFVFVIFLTPLDEEERGWRIVAVPQDEEERRCGWEAFSGFYTHLLGFVLAVLAGLWLMVIQNVYLRDFDTENIIQFILNMTKTQGTVVLSLAELPKLPENFFHWAFAHLGYFSPGKKVEVGAALVGLMAYGSVAVSVVLLGSTARRSKALALENIRAISHEIRETEHNTEERLDLMQFWPVAWISQWPLLGIMSVFVLSLIWYRLIVVIAVAVLIVLTPRLIEFAVETLGELVRLSFGSRNRGRRPPRRSR